MHPVQRRLFFSDFKRIIFQNKFILYQLTKMGVLDSEFFVSQKHTRGQNWLRRFRLIGLLSVAIWPEEERQRRRRCPLPVLRIQDTR